MNVSDSSTMVMSEEDTVMHVLEVVMIQTFSLKKGLNNFVTRGENSVTKELTQLHDMQTYFPLESNTLDR